MPSSDDSASTNRSSIHRRSRSLSRFSHPLPSSPIDKGFGEASAPRGRFVNTSRGSGFPEISLDDLAVEFFGSGDRGRSAARSSESSGATNAAVASNRRGRSVSRHGSGKTSGGGSEGKGRAGSNVSGGKVVPESNSRRRRSLSVVRYQISDSESDLDPSQSSGTRLKEKSFGVGNKQKPISHKADDSNCRPTLRRSLSQNDFKCHDGYSSHSSVLTDDEGKDAYFGNSVMEKTIRSIYARKAKQANGGVVDNGLYEAMRKELRHAVEEIRVELEQELVNRNSSVETFSDDLHSSDSGVRQLTSPFTRNYSTKQELSEKRRDSLGKMVMEEQRGQELPKTVKNLPPDLKNVVAENSSRTRKRSSDRSRMSKRLSEEAEKYIEDFISNVEDTDISSLDGDRSDTSSSLGGKAKPNFKIPAASRHVVPPGMDGVLLPWLQWETSNDATPYPRKNMFEPPTTPQTFPWEVNQDTSNTQDLFNHSGSSQGSWSPGVTIGVSGKVVEDIGSRFKKLGHYQNQSCRESRESRFDIDEYLKRPSNEDFLLERWKQQLKINCSGLLLCNRVFL